MPQDGVFTRQSSHFFLGCFSTASFLTAPVWVLAHPAHHRLVGASGMPKDGATVAQVSHNECVLWSPLPVGLQSPHQRLFLSAMLNEASFMPQTSQRPQHCELPLGLQPAHQRSLLPGMPNEGCFAPQSSHARFLLEVPLPMGLQSPHQRLFLGAMLNEACFSPQSSHFW
jgi:hypothetical protein